MRVPYIVVRDYSKNGVAPGYPLSKLKFIQSLEM